MSEVVVIEVSQLRALLAEAVQSALAAPNQVEWVAQKGSPLGVKGHCRAVRRRIDAQLPGAAVVGRRYLLSPEALTEELQRSDEPEYRARRARRGGTA